MGIETTWIGGLFPALAGAGVRGLVLLAVAGGLTLALRSSPAALRHLVWTVALAGVLVLPLVGPVIPEMDVRLPAGAAWLAAPPSTIESPERAWPAAGEEAAGAWEGVVPAERASAPPAGARPESLGTATREPAAAAVTSAAPSRPHWSLEGLLAVLWAAGAVLLLLPVAVGWAGVRRLERRSRPFETGPVAHLCTRLALRLGVAAEVRLVAGPAGSMPMTWGIRRPVVMLPEDAAGWALPRLEAVLLHELAHVKRRDCLTQLLAELVRALHWPDPLAWVAARRLRIERERACDDAALAGGARPSAYARELLELARGYRASRATALAAVAMARPSQLSDRLLAVLDEHRPRGGIGRRLAVRTVTLAAGLTLLVAAAAPAVPAGATPEAAVATAVATAAAEPPTASPKAASPETPEEPEVEALAEPALELMAALPVAQDLTCAAYRGDWEQVQHQRNDDRSRIQMRRRGCEIDVRLEGEVAFDAAAATIAGLGRDALVRIVEDDGRTERWLEIRPGPGGSPAFEYRVNRREAAFDGNAQAWYRAVLVQLFRRAGFAAEERVRAILDRGGVDAVLAEMDELSSGYVQAKYFQELVRQAELSEAQYRTVIRTAARRIDSDHYLSEILREVARHQELTARLLDDYVTAALQLDSDHYRTETLRAVIDSGRLSGTQVAAVLEAASEMDSDHYRTEILSHVADRYALDPEFRPAYLRAAAGLDSDHYRTEVLKRLLRRPDLTTAELAEVVAAARMVGSDHYRTEILRQVARLGLAEPALQRAYFQALEGIESSHYALQASRALLDQESVAPDLLPLLLAWAPAIGSDHHLSELLVDIAGRFPLRGRDRDAFLAAMDRVESSHYRGRVADALLRAERR